MSYAYLVVTIDVTKNPPRVLRSAVFASGAATLTPQTGRFQFDVMMASGRDFDSAKHNLYTISKLEPYFTRSNWAFGLLPEPELSKWKETKTR